MRETALTVENLAVSLPPQLACSRSQRLLNGINFQLGHGEMLGLVGDSGSGKSTLLRALARLIEPDDGRVLLFGRDWDEFTPRLYRRKVCLLSQVPVALPGTVEDNLGYVFHLHRNLPRVDPRHLLMEVNLPPHLLTQNAETMSVGEKQRLALARALAMQPQVLLLDEPTSALDETNAVQVLDLLTAICSRKGLSAILATHIREHLRIAHRKLLLSDGEVTENE